MDGEPAGLFAAPPAFTGLPADGFACFAIRERGERRRAIIEAFHPALQALGEILLPELASRSSIPLRARLPRLDWPPGYQPFCTWLAISRAEQGYQALAQLNLGVHTGYVAARLGWDTAAAGFGRFEFLCRFSGWGEWMARIAAEHGLGFRVYASAPWPRGSECVYASASDWEGALGAAGRRGVWFEVGVRHELPQALPLVTSPALADEALRVFTALLPLYDRIAGGSGEGPPGRS